MSKILGEITRENVAQHVDVSPDTGCWNWKFAMSSNGYGVKGRKGKTMLAHRVVYEVLRNPIPEGMQALHTCDNPRCCNPYHIFIGTNRDNARECVAKSRNSKIRVRSKLNDEAVSAIRASSETSASLARKYGVARTTIRRARSGISFNAVTRQTRSKTA